MATAGHRALTRILSGCYHESLDGSLPPHQRPRRLAWPRTSPFHGGNTGSNPVGDAKLLKYLAEALHLATPFKRVTRRTTFEFAACFSSDTASSYTS